ncbi:Tol-Pal system beta propeller repeat protein TolB [Candidatus Finniella inopinata]|uniref:Tol-Pal system protein TolB n=1 Tax=Candidatus Finniella inopinata TaxID=1696036 RepID=A0A4V2E032_9PROT|nr:Tol-Pal system beta propeller repeat protein TolB [Candidatus Finniella inopinata]RZI47147.1 Tol-Pal system protein TolB [Candidatus Finniella inopinata]
MIKIVVLWGFAALCLNTTQALKVEITQGLVRPDPIAITNFHSDDTSLSKLGENISGVVKADLERSGLFEAITRDAFIQTEESLAVGLPRFDDWRLIKSRFLVCGTIKDGGGEGVVIHFRLYDVITGQQMLALSLTGNHLNWRKIAHIVADQIFSRVTNEKGFFNTQMVYVETMGLRGKNIKKRLMRMDQDGENVETLTDGKDLVLMPRYSPDGKLIAYLRYVGKSAQVHITDAATGKTSPYGDLNKLLKGFGEMTFAPRFMPDSKTLVMSLVKGGKSAIYRFDLTTKTLTPLTPHRSIDTSPCPSPDGKHIVFTSDRDREGGEQIYVMDSDGGNVRRISFGEGKYSQPVWSPRGDLIVFTKQRGQFYIGLMQPDGTEERLIAQGYLVEAPDWAPNGRYLIFTQEERRSNKGQIRMVDLTGHHQRTVKTSRDSADCTWSPLLN